MSAGGWYFTKGPGKDVKFSDVLQRVTQGQAGQPSGLGQFGQYPAQGNYASAGQPGNNYSGYTAPPTNYQAYSQPAGSVPATYTSQSPPAGPPPPSPMFGGPAIRIASFNIQVFGDAKAEKKYVMATLGMIIRNFDVVAIQEIRTQDEYFIDNFLRTYVNLEGKTYDRVVGPRLGSTVSKEQYAFIYNTATIEVNPRSIYTVNDPDRLLERDPLVAMFRVRGPPPDQAFTFVLVDVHTRPQPDKAKEECNTLAQVYQVVRRAAGGEDDIIMLGDFNVDDKHLGELTQLDGVRPIVRNAFTNTKQNNQEDNIVIHAPSTAEFSGRWGVFDVQRIYNLRPEQALEVSDHYPVWAEFSAYESATPGRVANRGGTAVVQ